MRLITFASGSGGNCTLVQGGGASVLVDAGISLRRIRTALNGHGLGVDDLDAVVITHSHTDHVSALKMLTKYHAVPVYVTGRTAEQLCGMAPELTGRLRAVDPETPFSLGALTVTAFSTPHDTPGSVGYILEGPEGRMGVCTDTGCVTGEMLRHLVGCRAALIEANHDPDRLLRGPYPWPLKRRIRSESGHLSNEDCASLACALAAGGAESIVLGHLSRENNTPRLAFEAVRRTLDDRGFPGVQLTVAPPEGEVCVEIAACSVYS